MPQLSCNTVRCSNKSCILSIAEKKSLFNGITSEERKTNNGDKLALCAAASLKTEGHSCSVSTDGPIEFMKRNFWLPTRNWQDLLTFDMFWLGLSISSSCHY